MTVRRPLAAGRHNVYCLRTMRERGWFVLLFLLLIGVAVSELLPYSPGPTLAIIGVVKRGSLLIVGVQFLASALICLIATLRAICAWKKDGSRAVAMVRVAAFALVCTMVGPLLFRFSWEIQRAAFKATGERATPLISAITKFERDEGRPPRALRDLVPDYLSELPPTGIMGFGPFEYTSFEGEEQKEVVWYDLGSRKGRPMTGLWVYAYGDAGHAILALTVKGDVVEHARVDRLPEKPGNSEFDQALWKSSTDARMSMLEALKATGIFKEKSFSTIEGILGKPTGREQVRDSSWELSIPCSRGVLNWDVFFYWPTEKYPKSIYGGSVERMGRWAYVHE